VIGVIIPGAISREDRRASRRCDRPWLHDELGRLLAYGTDHHALIMMITLMACSTRTRTGMTVCRDRVAGRARADGAIGDQIATCETPDP
jgi:hypothetical protein